MNKITQTARYRQSLILYAQKHGVTAAAKRYRTYRQYIYRLAALSVICMMFIADLVKGGILE